MLWTIAVVLLVLWLLGLVTGLTMGYFIHILLVIAIVVVLIRVIQGRRPMSPTPALISRMTASTSDRSGSAINRLSSADYAKLFLIRQTICPENGKKCRILKFRQKPIPDLTMPA